MKRILILLLAAVLPLCLMAQDPNNKPQKPVTKKEVGQRPAKNASTQVKRTASKGSAQKKEDGRFINFKDKTVEAICLKYYDADGDGRLSKQEAADVPMLANNMFRLNSEITSFEELQYFTGLVKLNDQSFKQCRNLIRITLPEQLTAIGDQCFAFCDNLTAIHIPDSVKTIGSNCFLMCKNLVRVNLPEGLKRIEESAFSSCGNLLSISIPQSLTYIGENAFSSCSSLMSPIVIPSGVRTINKGIFWRCEQIPSVTFSSGVTGEIGEYAFCDCKAIASLSLPEGVSSIGESSFSGCDNLTEVSLPGTLTKIGKTAFGTCKSLPTITIPATVSFIGERAFWGSIRLQQVHFKSTTPPSMVRGEYNSVAGRNLFNDTCGLPEGVTVYVPQAAIGAYQQADIRSISETPIPIVGE